MKFLFMPQKRFSRVIGKVREIWNGNPDIVKLMNPKRLQIDCLLLSDTYLFITKSEPTLKEAFIIHLQQSLAKIESIRTDVMQSTPSQLHHTLNFNKSCSKYIMQWLLGGKYQRKMGEQNLYHVSWQNERLLFRLFFCCLSQIYCLTSINNVKYKWIYGFFKNVQKISPEILIKSVRIVRL